MIKTLYDPAVKEEGIKEGKKEGKKEVKKEVALAALKEGLSQDIIIKITGLDEKTIKELKEKSLKQ